MTRISPYFALTLLALTGCNTDSVREASAQQLPSTVSSDSDMRPASGPQHAYELRRVWSGSNLFNFYWNEPSPDGRYISEIHWNSGNLAVTNLVTGEMERVTQQTNNEGFAYGSVFSPDGKQLAYRWFNLADEIYDLRIIGVDGSNERILIEKRPDIRGILPTDWSPDGRHLLAAVERPDLTVQLALIAVADGSMQVLKSLGWHWPQEAVLSPDGRYVAYSTHQASSAADADPPDLRILAVDGSQEVTVAPHEGPQEMLGWTPDGGAVLFYRREGTSGSIWMVAIQDGRQAGEPILIEPDVRVSSIGFSKDAYFFGTQVESPQVHTAMMDPSGAGFVADPRPVGDPGSSGTGHGAWSVDGSQLAYVRQGPSDEPTLVVRAVDGGEERAIPLSTMEKVWDVVWAPDGESVLVMGVARARLNVGGAIYRIDLTSGDATTFLAAAPGPFMGGFAIDRVGETLYLGKYGEGVVRYDLSSGEETLLYADSVTTHIRVAVSPDGQMIAFTGSVGDPGKNSASRRAPLPWVGFQNRILVMPTNGREEARVVLSMPGSLQERLEPNTGITWTPDGSGVLFVRKLPGPGSSHLGPHVLSRVSVDGGPVTDIMEFTCYQGNSCTGPRDFRIHPESRRVVFNRGERKGEIWMMTGFGVGDAVSGASQGR